MFWNIEENYNTFKGSFFLQKYIKRVKSFEFCISFQFLHKSKCWREKILWRFIACWLFLFRREFSKSYILFLTYKIVFENFSGNTKRLWCLQRKLICQIHSFYLLEFVIRKWIIIIVCIEMLYINKQYLIYHNFNNFPSFKFKNKRTLNQHKIPSILISFKINKYPIWYLSFQWLHFAICSLLKQTPFNDKADFSTEVLELFIYKYCNEY